MTINLQMLQQLEQNIRETAHTQLLPRFRHIEHHFKSDGSIVTEADHAMQYALTEALKQNWPEIPLLGEEMSHAEQQTLLEQNQDCLWILDPLDGTSNFAAGIPCFAVSLALLINGSVKLGLIYDPLRQECFSAIENQGTWLNGTPLQSKNNQLPLSKCIAQIDFKRLSNGLAETLARHPPYSSQRSFGSGALDWCWLAAGRVHLYLHGAQKLWDYSAGQLILRESGGQCCTLDNEVVFRCKLESRSVIAALEPQHFIAWQDYIFKNSTHSGSRVL